MITTIIIINIVTIIIIIIIITIIIHTIINIDIIIVIIILIIILIITSHECEGAFWTPCPGAQNMENIKEEHEIRLDEHNLQKMRIKRQYVEDVTYGP